MPSPSFTLPAVIDDANPQLTANISAAATTIVVKSGEGAKLPTTYNGSATSTGTKTTLNSTAIGSSGVAVGDFIENITDGSYAVILTVSTNSITTTQLQGGSDDTWQNSDAWAVNRFVVTLAKVDANGTITQSEKALINQRSTDTLTVATGGRGYDGSAAAAFDADDYCYLLVTREAILELQKAIRNHEAKFDEVQKGQHTYAADAEASDTYVITLDPAPSAYAAGMTIRFKANTKNTGACTVNVNALGAKSLKVWVDEDPPDGYIQANSIVTAAYDGTNFLIQSVTALPGAGKINTESDAATVTFDLTQGDVQTVVLGGNRTLALSGDEDGQIFTVILEQDGTGSRTVTWWSNISWPSATTPTLTTTASKKDVFAFIRVTSTDYLGFIVGQDL